MARTVDTDRLAALRQVLLMLRRSSSFRETIAAHESGERPILIALIADPLSEVVERIHAVGLPVSLVVPGESGIPTVMTVTARHPQQQVGFRWEEAHPDATMGLIVSHFSKQGPTPLEVPDPAADRELVLQLVKPST
jgi:hypothetical protein